MLNETAFCFRFNAEELESVNKYLMSDFRIKKYHSFSSMVTLRQFLSFNKVICIGDESHKISIITETQERKLGAFVLQSNSISLFKQFS